MMKSKLAVIKPGVYPAVLALLLICVTFSLSSCATRPASAAAINQKMTWSQRQQRLTQIQSWTLNGGFVLKSPSNSLDASLHWQQTHQNNYTLNLFGPLGMGAVKITGQPGKFTLENAKGRVLRANNPESLMSEELGWSLPVSNLYYWVRALPAPGLRGTAQFDDYNHLSTLRQQGWTIHYLRYTAAGGFDLPSEMQLTNGPYSVRLIVSRWQLNTPHRNP